MSAAASCKMTTPPPDVAATVSWRELQGEATALLAAAGVERPEVDARWIVQEASGLEGADALLGWDDAATVRGVAAFDAMVARRVGGEPLQYVLGRWGFRSLDLMVDGRVLIPRPETEHVVGLALAELDRLAAYRTGSPLVVVDLGTGSGAIGLSIAAERSGTSVWATDISTDALEVASANIAGLGVAGTRVRLAKGSWFAALPPELVGSVDLIVSNPPYVAPGDPLPREVADWEPLGALMAGPTGLEALDIVVEHAPRWLGRPGVLVVELAPDQAEVVADAARSVGFTDVRVELDLTGRPRAVVARIGG